MNERHSESGARYAYVLPTAPAFGELRASYSALAKRFPWLECLTPAEGERAIAERDERTLLVFFHRPSKSAMLQPRRCKVGFVYSEPIGPIEAMSSDALAYRSAFLDIADGLDAVFLHTPDMVAQMDALHVASPAWLLPAGLDPEVLGSPSVSKMRDYFFYGAPVGKRAWVLPEFKRVMGDRLGGSDNCYGRDLNRELNASRASIYIAHSDVTSFSTWRIWHTIGVTSCAIVAEGDEKSRVDAWPLEPGKHYYPIPRITKENLRSTAEQLLGLTVDFPAMVERAAGLAPLFTAERCVEDYLVPMSIVQFGWR
jgi:hypothetical protein